MTAVLSDCLKVVVEKFLDLTVGEARYLCCFKTIVKEYEKEKGKLRGKRKGVQENVNVAKNRAEEIVNDVTVWIQNADNIINEDIEEKRTCFFGWCPNCMWQYRRGKELERKTNEITELKGLNFESVGRAAKLPGVEYHSSQDFIEFESRSSQRKQLLDALKDEQNYMVGLHGMGGTGKTTLVQKVGNEAKRSNLFDEVIFTTVSHAPDIRKIQDSIAIPLGVKLEEGDLLQRAKTLWSRLINGERILLILDDVWEELKFEDIGIPSRDNHNACRVLLTSRKLSVCNSMSCQSTIELELLSEEDAKILFEKHTGLRDDSSKSLKKLAQQIANECKRSPVAITAIAKSLKHQAPELWKAAFKSLKEFKQIHSVDEDLKIYKCFQDLGAIMKYFHTLEKLYIENSNIEGIFRVEELPIFGQQMSSSLQSLKLYNLHELRYTFMGPMHFISLQNVKALQIEGCNKLKVIFSASVLRSLPQLTYLEIKDCEGLQKIMEEAEEHQMQSNPHSRQVCFPKLIALVIKRCHGLKSLISVSTFHEFPKLELMIIKEASRLDDMFKSEQGDEVPRLKLLLPKLKYLVLMQLPNLADLSQQMELRTVTYSVVSHCPKLSFASTTTLEDLKNILEDSTIDHDVHWELFEILETIMEETENENPMPETISQLAVVQEVQHVQVQSAPERELPCSQIIGEADKEIVAVHDSEMATSSTDLEELVDEQVVNERSLRNQQEALTKSNFRMEIAWETVVPLPSNSTKKTMEQSLLEFPEAEKALTTIWSTNSEPRNPSPGPLLIPLQKASSLCVNGNAQEVPTSDETKMSPQLVERQSMDEQILIEQGTIRENKSFNGTPQIADEPSNGSVSKVVLSRTALAVPSNLPELDGSAHAPVGHLLIGTSSMISEINVTSSTSVSMQRMSRSLLKEIFNNNAKVDSFSPDTDNSSSSLILKADSSPELKTELAKYLNMSLEATIDANAFDHVERIISSLARETTDAFQQNILKDFTSRLKIFQESVPKAISTLQSSSEFISSYENMNMELNAKLNEGQEKIEDLETKLSETVAKEYTIEMEIQQLINQKNEILAQKNFLASQLDKYTQVVSKDYEKWKGLGEELKSCTDRWLKSKEDLAHANASWKVFKEILRL